MAPLLAGVQHIGIPVRDLDRSLRFYQQVLGCELLFTTEGSGPDLARMLAVPDAEVRFAFLRLGDTLIELLHYLTPAGQSYDRRNADVGACHVAFKVADIDAACRALEQRGVVFNAPPLRIAAGPLAGYAFVYFTDPDGIPLELFETPAEHQGGAS